MNVTILDYPISCIPYIYKVPSTSLIEDKFTMDSHRNIYAVVIDNEETSLASSAIQLLQDKKNDIDNPLWLSPFPGGNHIYSPHLRDTMTSLTKSVPS